MGSRNEWLIASSLATVAFASPAYGQSEPGAPPTDQNLPAPAVANAGQGGEADIIVTAQRRGERLQEVPISIVAINSDNLQDLGIRQLQDLNVAVPNLSISRNVKAATIFMRGVGTNSGAPGQEQNTAVYVDGVYYASMGADVASFNNIDHIEVLRGPQGTLFGRNSNGGLINIVTRRPSSTPTGEFELGYANYDTFSGSAYVSGPIAGNIAADLSVTGSNQGHGWGVNVADGREARYRNEINLRTRWLFTVGPNTEINLTGAYSHVYDHNSSERRTISTGGPPPSFDPLAFGGDIYDTTTNQFGLDRITAWAASLRFDHDFGGVKLVSISAWRDVNVITALDLDSTQADRLAAFYDPDFSRTFSQELQLVSPAGSRITWIGGLYYLYMDAGGSPLLQRIPALGAAQFSAFDVSLKTNSYSVYGQATVPLFGDRTSLTVGGRYTRDEKSATGRTYNALTTTALVDQSTGWGNFTYRVALDHRFTPEILGYASVSSGFKSGLYSLSSPNAPPVNPETLTNYEVGLKTDLLNRLLRVNVSAFYYDYQDIQLTRFTGTVNVFQNAAAGEIYGTELEVVARPVPGLTINLGAAYLHAVYKDFPDATGTRMDTTTGLGVGLVVNATGNRLLRTPKFTGNVGFEYEARTAIGTIAFGANLYHNGGFFWEPDNRLRQSAYDVVNAHLTWTDASDRWSVRVWARNLFGEEYYANQNAGAGRPDSGTPGEPMTYGVAAGFRF